MSTLEKGKSGNQSLAIKACQCLVHFSIDGSQSVFMKRQTRGEKQTN